jgi:hypothetical protein
MFLAEHAGIALGFAGALTGEQTAIRRLEAELCMQRAPTPISYRSGAPE